MAEDDKIRIDWGDLNDPSVDEELNRQGRAQEWARPLSSGFARTGAERPGEEKYGRVGRAGAPTGSGNPLYATWLYSALAGIVGALLAWAVTEMLVHGVLSEGTGLAPAAQSAVFFAVVGACLGASLCSAEGTINRRFSHALTAGVAGFFLGGLGGAAAGGVGQALYTLGATTDQNVVLVLDTSGSMEGQPLRELKRSARRFISQCESRQISMGVVRFSDAASVSAELSNEGAPGRAAISDLTALGGTNMTDGLRRGAELLAEQSGENCILLFSDGMPTVAKNVTLEELFKEELQKEGITEEEFLRREVERQGFSDYQLRTLTEDQAKRLGQAIFWDYCQRRGVLDRFNALAKSETVDAARALRGAGVQIVAVGAGEADRDFLSDVTGSRDRVLFASSGDISTAFEEAQEIVFKESDRETDRPLATVVLLRALCWAVAGALLALGQGLATGSGKKIRNAVLGGLIGGLIGGLLFDPIGRILEAEWASRLLGIAVIGCAVGAMIGVVEALLKEAWVQITAGHLAGKQFVIYRNPTVIGSSPKCDIYLFKDPSVAPRHAAISTDGRGYFIEDRGSSSGTVVNGQRIARAKLRSGDRIQVGKTDLLYSERAQTRGGR